VRSGYGLPLFALSFLAVAALLVGTGAIDLRISGSDKAVADSGGISAQPPGSHPDSASPTATGCKERWGQELRVALAAERTLEDWRLHIDAMNHLVHGQISVSQATALWEASEQGALRRIDRFERLDRFLRQSPSGCDTSVPSDDESACAKAARAVQRTIDTAQAAVRTWRVHIVDMDRLREGRITGKVAEEKWRRLWRTGQVQTVRYDRRATDALAHDCA